MDGSSLATAASTVVSLLAILFAIAAAAFLIRRLQARLPGRGAPSENIISIVASRPLGGAHSLIIAQAQGQHFLIGISRGGITAIGRLNPHE